MVPPSGNLRDYDLSQILEFLRSTKKTGILTLTNKGIEKRLFLKDGNIVFASSNQEADHLGDMLLRAGKITKQQFKTSSEILRKTGKKHGAILVELGYLTPKELFWGLKFQVKEIICSLFLWEEGKFSFEPKPMPQDVIPLPLDHVELIQEVINRIKV